MSNSIIKITIRRGDMRKVAMRIDRGTAKVLQDKSVTPSNNTQIITADENYYGLRNVEVLPAPTQSKSVVPATTQQSVTPDEGFSGLSEVVVEAAPTQDKYVTPTDAQQVVTFDDGYVGLSSVNVNAAPTQQLAVTPSNEQQTHNPSEGYVGFDEVTVNPIPFPDLRWVVDARNGLHTNVTGADMDTLEGFYSKSYGCHSLFRLARNIKSIDFGSLTTITSACLFQYLAYQTTSLTTVAFPNLETISAGWVFQYAFQGDTGITSVSFPKLKSMTGEHIMSYCFGGTAITIISFPELTTISGGSVFIQTFFGCKSLTRIEFPRLEQPASAQNLFRATFDGCTKLTDAYISPGCTGTSKEYSNNLIYSATKLKNVTLSQDAAKNMYFNNQPDLTFDSVKDILGHSNNANMNGKRIYFYSSGLTITDDADGTLAALKNAVVAQGCTIYSLTINPYTP